MWGSTARRGSWEPNRNKKNKSTLVLETNMYFKLFQILCHNLLPFQLSLSSYHPKFQDNNFSRMFYGILFILNFLEEPLFFQITPFSPCQISISYGDRKNKGTPKWLKILSKQHLPACYVTWVLERERRQTVMEIRFPGAASVPYDELAGNGYRIGLYREFSGGLRPVLVSTVVDGYTRFPFLSSIWV